MKYSNLLTFFKLYGNYLTHIKFLKTYAWYFLRFQMIVQGWCGQRNNRMNEKQLDKTRNNKETEDKCKTIVIQRNTWKNLNVTLKKKSELLEEFYLFI